MSIINKAKSFLGDLLSNEELANEIGNAQQNPVEPDSQFIVYFRGDKPDTCWEYCHKPDDGIPYGRLYGYWEVNEQGSSHFVEHKSNNLKLMDWETFLDRVPPNRDCIKIYDSESDFLLELI